MSFNLNNSKDIICDSLFLLDTNNTLQNVLDLMANASGSSGGITSLTGSGAAIRSGSGSTRNIEIDVIIFDHIFYFGSIICIY